MKCRKGFELKPYKSAAGWYIGTIDEEGDPYCRASKEYYPSYTACKEALKGDTWTLRQSIETIACCGE